MKKAIPKMNLSFPLDDITTFSFGKRKNINNGIFVVSKRKPNINYTKEYIKKYYNTSVKRDFKFDEENCFIISETHKLIFIPLANKKEEIVDFCYTNLENYDLVKGKIFHRYKEKVTERAYPKTNKISFQELIYGKKAKRGGWEIIETYTKAEEDEEYDEGIDDV